MMLDALLWNKISSMQNDCIKTYNVLIRILIKFAFESWLKNCQWIYEWSNLCISLLQTLPWTYSRATFTRLDSIIIFRYCNLRRNLHFFQNNIEANYVMKSHFLPLYLVTLWNESNFLKLWLKLLVKKFSSNMKDPQKYWSVSTLC